MSDFLPGYDEWKTTPPDDGEPPEVEPEEDPRDYECRFCCKYTGEFRSYCSRNCRIADEEGF